MKGQAIIAAVVISTTSISVTSAAVAAEKKYGPGVTDKEIKLGQTAPYSGPASAFSTTARVENDYLKMVNAAGGIGGRQINMISLDDGYSPPKTIDKTGH